MEENPTFSSVLSQQNVYRIACFGVAQKGRKKRTTSRGHNRK